MKVLKDEDRLFERFTARFPVKFRHSRGDFGTDVFLRDASALGVRFTTRQRMFLNDSVSLVVELPDGFDPLTLNGRVVWIKRKTPELWEAGVEFHKPDLMKMRRVFKLVNNTL
jgi:Tfp pilus assembly protein PilZ